MNNYQINSRVSVYIKQYSKAGLLGKVDKGAQAIIRQREIAWCTPSSLEEFIGQTLQAVVLRYDSRQERLELSLRLIERDPWKEVTAKYAVGNEIDGRIVGLIEKAAFVEIEPGIEAFLPISELPFATQNRMEDFLWIHDYIRASVVEIIPNQRRLRISVKALLALRDRHIQRQLWASQLEAPIEGSTLAEHLPNEIRLQLLRLGMNDDHVKPKRELRALLIETDEIFASGIESLLRSNGCRVVLAKDSLAGLKQIQNQTPTFDIIIIDWNLKFSGYTVIQELQRSKKESRVAVILDPVYCQQGLDIRNIMDGNDFDVFFKSDTEALEIGIISILRELQQSEIKIESRLHHQPSSLDSLPSIQFFSAPAGESSLSSQSYESRLLAILAQLKDITHATTVLVMRLDSGRPSPVIEAYSGKPPALEKASHEIIYSPLEDILLRGEEVLMEAKPESSRFDRLLAVLSFRGFIGIPIPTIESASYGLILFNENRSFINQNQHQARNAAHLIAQTLQERRLIQAFEPWQAQNLIGQLSSSIIHEVNNKLGGIELLIHRLQARIKDIARWPDKSQDATFLKEFEDDIEGISRAQHAASELRNWYLGLTAIDEPQSIDLRKLTREMIRALQSQAREHNVILNFKSPKRLPSINARPSQLRQVLVNLILNAIQQMAEIKRTGNLNVEISSLEEADFPIYVRFNDQGPGIHQELWEKIFDFGFTTKKSGAGLGLTIARQATARLGGTLYVESSHIFWGTCFLLKLPKGE